MKYSLYSLATLMMFALGMPAARAQYLSSGPNGGRVNAIFREQGGTLYMTGNGGIFRSQDEGKSWQELAPSPSTFNCNELYGVAVSGVDMYASSDVGGIFHSSDGGVTWTASRNGLSIAPGRFYTDIQPVGPNVLAIRPDSGYLYLSQDQGSSWGRINPAIVNARAQYLSILNNDVYVSTPQGLFKSMDNGQTFTNINATPGDFGKLIWVGDTAYVATSTGIKRSLDQGQTFDTLALTGRAVRDVAVTANRIYAVVRGIAPIQDSVLVSTDSGKTFTAAPFNPSHFRFTTINDIAATSAGLLVGSDYGVYSSVDSGATWGLADSGFHGAPVGGVAVSGAWVVAGTTPMGLFRALPDSGTLVWQHTGDVAHNVDPNIQAVAASGNVVHAGGTFGYYRSTDNGASWTAGVPGAMGGNVKSIYASPDDSEVWMIRNGNLYYSSNAGATFGGVVTSQLPINQCENVMQADTALFVFAAGTLYKAGSSMSFTATTGITGYVTSVVHLGNTFFAATRSNGLFTSPDGASWSSYVVPAPGSLPNAIYALMPDSAGIGLVAGTGDGIYSNSNGGIWHSDGLAGHVVRSLAMRNGKIFAGTCSGVYSIPYKLVPPDNGVANEGGRSLAMQVLPNPSEGDFRIQMRSPAAGAVMLSMYDPMGRLVLRRPVVLLTGVNEIPVRGAFVPGVYVVQLAGEGISGAVQVVLR